MEEVERLPSAQSGRNQDALLQAARRTGDGARFRPPGRRATSARRHPQSLHPTRHSDDGGHGITPPWGKAPRYTQVHPLGHGRQNSRLRSVSAVSLTRLLRSVTSTSVSATSGGASGAHRLISVSQNTLHARMQKMAIRLVNLLAVRNCESSALQPDFKFL